MNFSKSFLLVTALLLTTAGNIARASNICTIGCAYADNLIDYGYYNTSTNSYVSQSDPDLDFSIISEFSTTNPPADYTSIGSLGGRLMHPAGETAADGAGISLVGVSGTTYGGVFDRDYMVLELSEAISAIDGIDLKIVDTDHPSLYASKAAKVYYSTTAEPSSFLFLSDIFGETGNNGDIEFGDISGIIRLRIEQDGGGTSFQPLHLDAIYQPEVAMVPIPAAVWLFGSGLLGLVATGRRHKK